MERAAITERAERILQDAATMLMTPKAGECLVCFVGCEMFMNTYEPAARLWVQAHESAEPDDCDERSDLEQPATLPPCETTRRGSTKPCANWERVYRSRYR